MTRSLESRIIGAKLENRLQPAASKIKLDSNSRKASVSPR